MTGLPVQLCPNCTEPMTEIAAYEPYAVVYRCMTDNCRACECRLTHDQVAAMLRPTAMDDVFEAVKGVA
jgi:hypothetical protein